MISTIATFTYTLNTSTARPTATSGDDGGQQLTLVSYNLWNVMFHFDIRKYAIADMIRSTDADIIGLQEVRQYVADGHSQVDELQTLLPEYPYTAYQWSSSEDHSNNDPLPAGAPPRSHYREGVAIMSRYPLVDSNRVVLTSLPHDQDTNQRIALHATVMLPDGGTSSIVVTHISYAKHVQCRNFWELRQLAQTLQPPVIMMGDWNVYGDYGWPVELLTHHALAAENPCIGILQKEKLVNDLLQPLNVASGGHEAGAITTPERSVTFMDAWLSHESITPQVSATNADHVIQLTPTDFDSKVLQSEDIWMVEFYAPWCGHCQRLAPIWRQASQMVYDTHHQATDTNKGYTIHLGAVDCVAYAALATSYGIRGFPTIKIFGAGKAAKRNEPNASPASVTTDYQGDRTVAAIVTFAATLMDTVKEMPPITPLLLSAVATDPIVGASANGFTFSNMPYPGMQSRPDRIYLSQQSTSVATGAAVNGVEPNWKVLDFNLFGNGSDYLKRYKSNILWHRFWLAVDNSVECPYDCGPHGKCQCGICVAAATEICHVPCQRCQPLANEYSRLQWRVFPVFVFISAVLAWITRRLMTHACGWNTKPTNTPLAPSVARFDIEGGLLSNTGGTNITRRQCHLLGARIGHLGVTVMIAFLWLALIISLLMVNERYTVLINNDVISVINNTVLQVLPEEYFPSDHLMITTRLQRI